MLRMTCARVATAVSVASARAPVVTRRWATTFYTKDHEYAKVDGKMATVGISDFAQTQLGDVVYVSLPNVGDKLKKGEPFASVESVKAASDVYAPVSGTVKEVNAALKDQTALVNEDAEGKAWFAKIELSAPEEVGSMMETAAYKKHCEDAAKHH